MRFALVSFALVMGVSSPAFAEAEPAPFGLAWGMSVSDFSDGGDRCKEGVCYLPGSLGPGDTKSISAHFSTGHGLQSIVWVAQPFQNDQGGTGGRLRYKEVSDNFANNGCVVATKYEMASDPNEFYRCIADASCGAWYSRWSCGETEAVITIKGTAPKTGLLLLAYLGPQFGEASVEEASRGDGGTGMEPVISLVNSLPSPNLMRLPKAEPRGAEIRRNDEPPLPMWAWAVGGVVGVLALLGIFFRRFQGGTDGFLGRVPGSRGRMPYSPTRDHHVGGTEEDQLQEPYTEEEAPEQPTEAYEEEPRE